jgi:hypothetical protein
MKKTHAILAAGLLVVVTPSPAWQRICGNLYHDSTGQWEHGCWNKPPSAQPGHFIRDDSGKPLTTPPPQAAGPTPGGGPCGKLWVPSRNHWEVRCLSNPPTDGTFIANQGGKNPSPQELRSTPPPSGGYAQTGHPVQAEQAQPPQADPNALVNQATNLWHSLTHK